MPAMVQIDHSNRPPAIIDFQKVDKVYDGETGTIAAIEGMDLQIFPGEFVSILGPSGCGKSTTLNLMAGLEVPTRGRVSFHDTPLQRVPRSIGYVFQEPTLLPWRTVRGNIALPLEIVNGGGHPEAIAHALDLVGLQEFGSEYPASLSVGMRQKVAIARALVYDPEVLLMDEPFSSLDSISREQLNFQLLEIWQRTGKTIVFVTHSISEAILLSDRIYLLTDRPGRVAEQFNVCIPRPRRKSTLSSPAFAGLLAEIHQTMGRLADE